jgi:PAS domain S-box-containing protein
VDLSAEGLPRLRPKDLLNVFVDSAADHGLFVLDPRGVVRAWNKSARRVHGWSAREIVGRHVSLLHTPEDRAAGRAERLLAEARRKGRARAEGWRRRRDGSRFWAGVVLTALKDARRRLVGFAVVTRDLTERRRGEEALARAEHDLAEASDFLAREVGESLGRISTFGAMLEQKAVEDEARALVTYIVDNTARLQALVVGMLEYTKTAGPRAGFAPTSLRVVMAEAARKLTEDLRIGASVSFGALPPVHGDAVLLVRLFLHLLLTLATTGRGGRRLAILVDAIEREGAWVIRLRAARAAVPPDDAAQASGAAASSVDLAVAMKLASAHGGSVWTRSGPEPGREFFVSLPGLEPPRRRR